jgi:hypothetical protein
MEIITDAQLLERIEAFLEKHKMAASKFGKEAMGDGALVFHLRGATKNKSGKPRSLTLEKAGDVVRYMEGYEAEPQQAAA